MASSSRLRPLCKELPSVPWRGRWCRLHRHGLSAERATACEGRGKGKRELEPTRIIAKSGNSNSARESPPVLRALLSRMKSPGTAGQPSVKRDTRFTVRMLLAFANPVRMIHLQSEGFAEGILDRICGAFDYRNTKTLSGRFPLDIVSQPHQHQAMAASEFLPV
jgi:hypothetical protein